MAKTATATEYEEAIRGLKHNGLLRLWAAIESGSTPTWPPGKAFEYLVIRSFEVEGAHVRYPFSVFKDGVNEQIDGVIYLPELTVVVESKDRGKLNIEPVMKLRGQLQRRPLGVVGAVFSRGGFTAPALKLNQWMPQPSVLLWDGDEIFYALRKRRIGQGMWIKYCKAVETGTLDFNLVTESAL